MKLLRRGPEPPADPQLREAAARIRAEVNAGRLGVAAVILRGYPVADRDRICDLLERRRHPRGQALVEFALILPMLLVLMLGGIAAGLVMFDRMRLSHAAVEGAQAGAEAGGDCSTALEAAETVLGRPSGDSGCIAADGLLAVTLTDELVFPVPFVAESWTVSVTERSLFDVES